MFAMNNMREGHKRFSLFSTEASILLNWDK